MTKETIKLNIIIKSMMAKSKPMLHPQRFKLARNFQF